MTCVCAQVMYWFKETVSFIFIASPEASTVLAKEMLNKCEKYNIQSANKIKI